MTTAQQAPAAQPAAAPAPSPAPAQPATPTTLEERASQVYAELRGNPASPQAAGDENSTSPTPPASSPAASADVDTVRAERRARLEALHKQDRERVDQKQRQAAADKAAREAEQARKEAAEARALAEARIDPKTLDEAGFFRLAEKLEVPPQKLAEWMREKIANPERAAAAEAAAAAKKALDPEVAAVKAELEQLKKEREAERQQQEHAKALHTERQAANDFFKLTESRADVAPHAAAFLQKKGPDALYQLAHAAAMSVPPGAGLEAVLDVVEERLADFASVYGHTATPSQGQAPPKPAAAAKANTVSNKLAATRASVVEEEDLSSLSLDERAQRLIKQLA